MKPAFYGDVELINARWDLESGRSVDFRIGGNGFERMHPFKTFQRARGGRLGTRFMAVIVDELRVARVNGEVMLKNWTETATGGQQVSLWLDNESSLHPFAGCRARKRDDPGEMFKLSLVEIDEVEEQPPMEGEMRVQKPSQQAHNLVVRNPMFIRYLKETKPTMANWDPDVAKRYVKARLGVESLGDLDKLPAKAREYQEQIVNPYERWKGGH